MERTLVIGHWTLDIRRAAAVVLGALIVAAAAQVSVPLPGTPVPMTLQPMAVLLVGGLLGAPLGALSMILYLAMGAAGLPVFTPTVPLVGLARDTFGPLAGIAVGIAAFAISFPVVNAYTAGITRLAAALGRRGALPAWVGQLTRSGLPRRALLLVSLSSGIGLGATYLAGWRIADSVKIDDKTRHVLALRFAKEA